MRHCAFLLLLLNMLSAGICYSAFAAKNTFVKMSLLNAHYKTGNNGEDPQPRTVYSEETSEPSDCDVSEAESYLPAFSPLQKGYKITSHRVKSVEKKVLNDLAYNYGYYEVSGTQNGKNWGPQKMAYLILWKKMSPERWKMYLDVWDYKQDAQQELYLF